MIRYISFLIVSVNFLCFTTSQNNDNYDAIVEQIKTIKEMPYIPELSGDSIYWEVVKCKLDIVPFLIHKLDDSTKTKAFVPNFGGEYTVSDISYSAIREIIHGIPTAEIIPNYNKSNGYWDYWKFVRESPQNRKILKDNVFKWYKENRHLLKWVIDDRRYRTSEDWKFKSNNHPAGGYYIVSY